ncbi:helix-turn-helix domain-containing protein [Streptomyces sp. AC536]|uniref:helix-turn-helix domain-containing protein n=1 Tax=Streptomyces buecherae TaxID=2763006 RepID=UPI00164D17F8|nr:helix-turn-helix transcriptional regulator [Streptomyces buecherae]MBC3982814.1 helix-turn-helix domain-containing protein [Streptomyces buecherae]QNJ41357.1 helix-turn-helix domain-containing protein [Streptomyces buecherae]
MSARPRDLTPDRSARHLFGAEMRRLREAAGMSLDALGEVLKYGKSSLHRFETAQTMVPPDLPTKLDTAFGTDGLFGKLYELARKEVHPDRYRRRMELEAQARVINEYAGHVVPGLVQTDPYARALFRVSNPQAIPEEIEDKVSARLSRQALLRAEPPPELSIILDETVLRRVVGGPAVMREQLATLLPLVDGPATVIQVMPFSHGAHALLGGSLTLMTLEKGAVIAYEESIDTGNLLEDPIEATARRRAYDRMRAHALSPTDSAALIRSTMEALPHEHHTRT